MYQPFDTFYFRTPFFTFNSIEQIEKQGGNEFDEMLQIASPDLHTELNKSNKEKTDRVSFALYRYYQRACTRPTPYGLFAGCSVGNIGDKTQVVLQSSNQYRRYTRLDMDYLCALIRKIEHDQTIREQLVFYPNNSIYFIRDKIRYVEYSYRNTNRIYQIAEVANSDYLQKILVASKRGISFVNLISLLISEDIDIDEAMDFINDLIDAQMLISELEPTVTDAKPLSSLIDKLSRLSESQNYICTLEFINKQLLRIDQQPIGKSINIYPKVPNIELINSKTEIKNQFQTDLFKPAKCASVSSTIISDIQEALTFLNKITPYSSSRELFSELKKNFIKRYDGREMPLLHVLDNEMGIGYPYNESGDINPLIDNLVIQKRAKSPSSINISSFQSTMMKKYQQAINHNQQEIILRDNDLDETKIHWGDIPTTISVTCQLLEDTNSQRSIFIKSVGGFSAASLLGRFCHLDDELLNHALDITEKESQINPNVIFAEIVHLPQPRFGNIILRPILRPYEIAYLTRPMVTEDFVIQLSDLFLSVSNNRLILRSKRLNKEIIPRLSSAHNFRGQGSIPVYQFLCDMQHQAGRTELRFSWGELAKQFDFLPRVSYKNCILFRASWLVKNEEINYLLNIKDDIELSNKTHEWIDRRKIPKEVFWEDGDNELYINMNNTLSIRSWLSVVKRHSTIWLTEVLFNPDTAIVHGDDGVFNNEFVFAFYNDKHTI